MSDYHALLVSGISLSSVPGKMHVIHSGGVYYLCKKNDKGKWEIVRESETPITVGTIEAESEQ